MKERRRSSLPRHGKGSWDEEKKEKVQGEEISRGEAVATRGVDSELRLNRKQQAASTTPKAVSSATKAKRAAVAY
ncbi:hypothetical protein L2E82_49821 [Cichorium intybus]|uniref:Uncharacterized protein n=1 Tax=Cichorium intybus TaxID=13427 RepID=A0ACB8Z0E8_CICIN|nr:hypothetical protein L2E82_49821 [Cichorium intybus]